MARCTRLIISCLLLAISLDALCALEAENDPTLDVIRSQDQEEADPKLNKEPFEPIDRLEGNTDSVGPSQPDEEVRIRNPEPHGGNKIIRETHRRGVDQETGDNLLATYLKTNGISPTEEQTVIDAHAFREEQSEKDEENYNEEQTETNESHPADRTETSDQIPDNEVETDTNNLQNGEGQTDQVEEINESVVEEPEQIDNEYQSHNNEEEIKYGEEPTNENVRPLQGSEPELNVEEENAVDIQEQEPFNEIEYKHEPLETETETDMIHEDGVSHEENEMQGVSEHEEEYEEPAEVDSRGNIEEVEMNEQLEHTYLGFEQEEVEPYQHETSESEEKEELLAEMEEINNEKKEIPVDEETEIYKEELEEEEEETIEEQEEETEEEQEQSDEQVIDVNNDVEEYEEITNDIVEWNEDSPPMVSKLFEYERRLNHNGRVKGYSVITEGVLDPFDKYEEEEEHVETSRDEEEEALQAVDADNVESPGWLSDIQQEPVGETPEAVPPPEMDNICELPPETGPCRMYLQRYYYNARTKECDLFIYGGCNGNKNNFESIRDCMNTCLKNNSS